jgi:hypothetical protein
MMMKCIKDVDLNRRGCKIGYESIKVASDFETIFKIKQKLSIGPSR